MSLLFRKYELKFRPPNYTMTFHTTYLTPPMRYPKYYGQTGVACNVARNKYIYFVAKTEAKIQQVGGQH